MPLSVSGQSFFKQIFSHNYVGFFMSCICVGHCGLVNNTVFFRHSPFKGQASFLDFGQLHNFSSTFSLNQTLSIWLGIQFRQRYSLIKVWMPIFCVNIFGLAWPWDRRGPGTYSRFVQSPLMIDLCMVVLFMYLLKNTKIAMI